LPPELEATAYQIADNRTHGKSAWDESALATILEHLREEDALEGVGFAEEEIDDLIARLYAELGTGHLEDADQAPAPPDAATTRRGGLWVIGVRRLICGDGGSWPDVERLLAGEVIHLLNTDPVYIVKVEPRSTMRSLPASRRSRPPSRPSSEARPRSPS
jgi:hypothetical protein